MARIPEKQPLGPAPLLASERIPGHRRREKEYFPERLLYLCHNLGNPTLQGRKDFLQSFFQTPLTLKRAAGLVPSWTNKIQSEQSGAAQWGASRQRTPPAGTTVTWTQRSWRAPGPRHRPCWARAASGGRASAAARSDRVQSPWRRVHHKTAQELKRGGHAPLPRPRVATPSYAHAQIHKSTAGLARAQTAPRQTPARKAGF